MTTSKRSSAAGQRNTYILTTTEEVTATEVAETEISTILGGTEILDSVEVMAGEEIPEQGSILVNDDFGIVTVDLTEKEAAGLAKKTGVEFVEEDEQVFASSLLNGDSDLVDDEASLAPSSEDLDAAAAIEQAFDHSEQEEISDEEAAQRAAIASETEPAGSDEIDFDEQGRVFALDGSQDPFVTEAFSNLGIPTDKIYDIVKNVVTSALKEAADVVADEVDEQQVERLLQSEGLSGQRDSVQAIRDYITCGLKIIYTPQAWRYSTGAGVKVAVVDTGIANRHPDLRVYGGVSYVPGVSSWNDDQGHGTHVAGTIAATYNNRGVIGVAPHAKLYAVKVLSRNGSGTTSGVINGLAWCYRTRMHVANLSLGSGASTHSQNDYSRAYERAGRLLRRRGILAVAAAGNSGNTTRPYVGNPARCPSFMAVAAVDCQRKRARFSSYGPQVEISGPGVDTWSTSPPNGYRKLSGTSMASPHVAGVAALIKRRHPSWSGDRIRVHMWRTANDLGPTGRDWAYGNGLVNAYRSVR